MGRGSAIGDAFVRLVTALGLYAVLTGGAFFALGALWPRYHTHADGQTGMGTGLLGLGAMLLGALLVSVSLGRLLRSRLSASGRRVLRRVVLVAILSSALAAGLVVLGGVDAKSASVFKKVIICERENIEYSTVRDNIHRRSTRAATVASPQQKSAPCADGTGYMDEGASSTRRYSRKYPPRGHPWRGDRRWPAA